MKIYWELMGILDLILPARYLHIMGFSLEMIHQDHQAKFGTPYFHIFPKIWPKMAA